MSPNSYLLLENCCLVTFYLSSFSLIYRYDTIDNFHIFIGTQINYEMDYSDVCDLMVELINMEVKAKTWIGNNSNEYNTIQNSADQNKIVAENIVLHPF